MTSVPLVSCGKPSFSVVRFCVNLRYQAVDVAFSSSVGVNHFELVRAFHNSLDYSMADVAHFYLKCMRIDQKEGQMCILYCQLDSFLLAAEL